MELFSLWEIISPRTFSGSSYVKETSRETTTGKTNQDVYIFNQHFFQTFLCYLQTEDSICPADFCDLIRCEVLHLTEISKNQNQTSEFQNPREQQQTITALVKATPRANALSRYNQHADICLTDDEQCKRQGQIDRNFWFFPPFPISLYIMKYLFFYWLHIGWLILPSQLPQMHCCSPAPSSLAKPVSNQTVTQCRTNNTSDVNPETMLPSTSKEEELSERIRQKQSSCRDEDFIQLRSECARLIGMCTTGLILRLSNQQFLHLRGEDIIISEER